MKMRKAKMVLAMMLVVGGSTLLITSGCEGIRFAPSEAQKQNAWVHNRTAAIASQTAQSEQASEKLQELTKLSETQSQAFVAYYGMPQELPKADTVNDVLSESNKQLAATAIKESSQRPDAWDIADSTLELGIAIAGLFGGAGAIRVMSFLQQAKAKSNALKEIVLANEIFKKTNPDSAEAFKDAQKNQSPLTKQIVAEAKSGA
jgi:hypothetical protein